MPIQGILLDFGNVIATFDHLRPCRWISEKTGRPVEEIRKAIFGEGNPAHLHEAGLSSDVFYKEVCTRTGLTESKENFFAEWRNIFTENSSISRLLDRIHPSIKIGVVSNTDRVHWQRIEQMPLMRQFFPNNQYVTTSFTVQARKPDQKIYDTALTMIRCEAQETLYIDDVGMYVQAFRNFGGKAEIYDCSIHPTRRLQRILESFELLM